MSSDRDSAAPGIKEERITIAKYDKSTTTAPLSELDPIEVIEIVNGVIVRHETKKGDA